MKLFLQKNAKFSSAGGSAPRPQISPPNCKFLATSLFVCLFFHSRFYNSKFAILTLLSQVRKMRDRIAFRHPIEAFGELYSPPPPFQEPSIGEYSIKIAIVL